MFRPDHFRGEWQVRLKSRTLRARPCGIRGRLQPRRFSLWLLAAGLSVALMVSWLAQGMESLRHAQYDFWRASDGLPHHDVTSLAQTPEGYIWVGTGASSNSLRRFNGIEFASVPMASGGRPGGTWLAGGKEGRLWVSKASGESGSLALQQAGRTTAVELALPAPTFWGIPLFEDMSARLWIGGRGLLVRAADGTIKDFSSVTNEFGDIRRIAEDTQGTIWLATSRGLARFRDGTFDQPWPVPRNLLTVYPSREGSLWLGAESDAGLIQLTPSGKVITYGPSQGLVARGVGAICEDSRSNIWVGTYSGLCVVRGEQVHPVRETDLKTAFIFCLLWDREGSLWAGTADGLCRVRSNPVEYYGASDGLGPVNSLYAGPRGIWATVYSRGAYLFEEEDWKGVLTDPQFGDGSLLESASGDLWLATGQECFREHGGKVESIPGITGNLRFFSQGESTWIVTSNRLYAVRAGSAAQVGEDWPPVEVICVATNSGEGLLVGTSDGVYLWGERREKWLALGREVPGTRVNAMKWQGGSFWLATDLAIARFQQGRWQAFRTEAALEGTGGVNSLLVADEHLWLGCANGLFRVSQADADACLRGAITSIPAFKYGKAEGVRSGYLGPGLWGTGAVRGKDGRLWFASKNGVIAVKPGQDLATGPPPVVIERVELDSRAVADNVLRRDEPLQIRAGISSLEIHYAALTFIAPERVTYKYRLWGLDPEWVEAGNSRAARYATLPPGSYEFQVAACSADGIWNETGAAVRLVQEPFFHQTRLFYVLCWVAGVLGALALAISVAMIARAISLRAMKRRLALLEAQQSLDRERARIARDIHDDLGSTLTQIVLLTELARREPEQTHSPEGHLAGIRTAAREITRRLDEIVWAINPRNDTLDAVVSYIGKFVMDQGRAAGVRCRLDLPRSVPAWPISGTARHNLFLACKEAIHNAIKHGGPTELRFRVALHEDGFTVEVADNGVGLSASSGGNSEGDGLLNLRDRLAVLGGTCRIAGEPGHGTVVSFRLPRPIEGKPLSTI